jgi:hypothetical protein
MKRIGLTIVGLIMGIALSKQTALADSGSATSSLPLPALTAEWWQWALSIPTGQNPQSDATGQYCMVGQRGPVWFLAGTFNGDTATRSCSVPENTVLFFPVANAININSPNVCGSGPENESVKDLRAMSKATIDGATDLSVQVDGESANKLIQRVQSQVFEVALPEDNVFDAPCAAAGYGNVPAAIYSPTVDDGYYVALGPLKRGTHTVHFQAMAGPNGSNEDVTYNLTVVPVLTK